MTTQFVEGYRIAVWLHRRGENDQIAALRCDWLRDAKFLVLRGRGCPEHAIYNLAGRSIRQWPDIARFGADRRGA